MPADIPGSPELPDGRELSASLRDLQSQLESLSSLSGRFSASISQAFVDATVRGKSLGDTLSTLTMRLSEMTLKAAFAPLTDQLGTSLSGLLTGAGSHFNPTGFAKGGAFAPMPTPFADGGVIASPITFPLDGGGTGLAGEAGPEAILPLARGADGGLGVRSAGGGAPVSVTFNVSTPDAESFRRAEGQLSAMLARAVAQGQRNL
jgi:phage-related minor tail protein